MATRKERRKKEEALYNIEQAEFLKDQRTKLFQTMQEQTLQYDEMKERRIEYYKDYKDKKDKAKAIMRVNEEMTSKGDYVLVYALRAYVKLFLFTNSNDEVIHLYKRRLQKEMQKQILMNEYYALGNATFVYLVTRALKSWKPSDAVFYFFVPLCICNYFLLDGEIHKAYEIAYPAHPKIIGERNKTMYKMAYHYPK